MRFEGQRTVLAPPGAVWDAILDPTVLRRCIPGCQKVEREGAVYQISATVSVLLYRGAYSGRVTLVNPVRPHSFQLDADTAIGVISAFLTCSGAQTTTVGYFCEAHVEGSLLRFGEPLIRSVANRLLDQYFACLSDYLAKERPPLVEERGPGDIARER
ncbi:MAG: carbon monoxide dehydrogenase subunit G [Dehalococcoidia bacterium]